jgi:hypothetical protein
VARAHWQAALARLGPPVQAAIDWMNASLHAALAWIGATLRAGAAFVLPGVRGVFELLAAHWQPIVIATAAAAAIGLPLIAILRWTRRRRRIKASLVEVTLDRDPQTAWLNLAIVVRNFQPHALVVRNLQVLRPAGTKVCERWKAWEPAEGSAKFVAPDLDLTNAADIERTIPPHGASSQYDDLGDRGGERRQTDPDELKRSFYLLPPSPRATEALTLHAVLHCEIASRRGRKLRLAFRRALEQAQPAAAALPATT